MRALFRSPRRSTGASASARSSAPDAGHRGHLSMSPLPSESTTGSITQSREPKPTLMPPPAARAARHAAALGVCRGVRRDVDERVWRSRADRPRASRQQLGDIVVVHQMHGRGAENVTRGPAARGAACGRRASRRGGSAGRRSSQCMSTRGRVRRRARGSSALRALPAVPLEVRIPLDHVDAEVERTLRFASAGRAAGRPAGRRPAAVDPDWDFTAASPRASNASTSSRSSHTSTCERIASSPWLPPSPQCCSASLDQRLLRQLRLQLAHSAMPSSSVPLSFTRAGYRHQRRVHVKWASTKAG